VPAPGGSIACRQPSQAIPSAGARFPHTKIARRAGTFIVVRKLPLIGGHSDRRLDRTVDNSCESTRAARGEDGGFFYGPAKPVI